MTRILKVLIAVLCLSFTSVFFAADKGTKITFKWVDDNGVPQYTERPPKNKAYEKITVRTGGSREVTQVTQEDAVKAAQVETQTEMDDLTKANERNCKVAQQNMQVLQQMARIRVTGDDGEERIMSPEEKQERVNETQKQINIYCKAS